MLVNRASFVVVTEDIYLAGKKHSTLLERFTSDYDLFSYYLVIQKIVYLPIYLHVHIVYTYVNTIS